MGFNYRTYTGLGRQTLGGDKQNLVGTRTQEKEALLCDPVPAPSPKESDNEARPGQAVTEEWDISGGMPGM